MMAVEHEHVANVFRFLFDSNRFENVVKMMMSSSLSNDMDSIDFSDVIVLLLYYDVSKVVVDMREFVVHRMIHSMSKLLALMMFHSNVSYQLDFDLLSNCVYVKVFDLLMV